MLLIPMLPPLSGVAISQSTLDNVQTQAGTITATETLNVVTASDSTMATTTATGNAVSGAVVTGAFAAKSTQTLTGAVNAATTVNVATNAGTQASLSTAATGNTGDLGSYSGGGALTGTVNQSISAAGSTTGTSTINATNAQAGAVSANVQAIGNSQGVTVGDTSATVTINQTNAGQTNATGGISLSYTPGAATLTATTVSNNVTATGTGNSSQALTVNQTASGQSVSEQDVYLGNGQTITGAATSTGNNISISNTTGGLSVTENQSNSGYVQAQAQVSGYEFGSGEADAYAVGNSALAGNYGSTLNLSNTQATSGNGVSSLASYSGNNGYDAYANATAMGNAVTGYACSNCSGAMSVSNSQTNSVGVGATTQIDIAAGNRSVTGTATAVGNSATFYVSKPTH